MDDEKFCGVENYSVLIPYKDLEKLLKTAQNAEKATQEVKRLEKRLSAMDERFFEIWEKLGEIDKIL